MEVHLTPNIAAQVGRQNRGVVCGAAGLIRQAALVLRFLPAALLTVLSCALFACGAEGSRNLPVAGTLQEVQVMAVQGANRNLSTSLDIVFVYDSRDYPLLPRTSSKWFDAKQALIQALTSRLEVVSIEVPPGLTRRSVTHSSRKRTAAKVLVYANYSAPEGQIVADISQYACVLISLDVNNFVLMPCGNRQVQLWPNLSLRNEKRG